MAVGFLVLVLNLAVAIISADPILKPCKKNDEACVTASSKAAYKVLIQGVPEIGVESSDPLHIDVTDGNISGLKYTLADYTIEGLKECTVGSAKLDMDKSNFVVSLDCPKGVFNGDYDLSGTLVALPVEGKGKFTVIAKKFSIKIDSEVKKVDAPDGTSHLSIKNFKIEPSFDTDGNVHFDFQNLFNGQKDLADQVLNFANDNWNQMMSLFQGPIWNSVFKKVIKNVNKYLKTVPVDDLLVQN